MTFLQVYCCGQPTVAGFRAALEKVTIILHVIVLFDLALLSTLFVKRGQTSFQNICVLHTYVYSHLVANGQYMELEKQLDKGVRNHRTSGASGEKGSFRWAASQCRRRRRRKPGTRETNPNLPQPGLELDCCVAVGVVGVVEVVAKKRAADFWSKGKGDQKSSPFPCFPA